MAMYVLPESTARCLWTYFRFSSVYNTSDNLVRPSFVLFFGYITAWKVSIEIEICSWVVIATDWLRLIPSKKLLAALLCLVNETDVTRLTIASLFTSQRAKQFENIYVIIRLFFALSFILFVTTVCCNTESGLQAWLWEGFDALCNRWVAQVCNDAGVRALVHGQW